MNVFEEMITLAKNTVHKAEGDEAAVTVDPIALLEAQHKEVDELFKKMLDTTKVGHHGRAAILHELNTKLTIHTQIEETIFYPAARQADEALVLESFEEHDLVKNVLQKLAGLETSDESFMPKITVLKELVQHHVKEEEHDLFPKTRKALDAEALAKLGTELTAATERLSKTPEKVAPPRRIAPKKAASVRSPAKKTATKGKAKSKSKAAAPQRQTKAPTTSRSHAKKPLRIKKSKTK